MRQKISSFLLFSAYFLSGCGSSKIDPSFFGNPVTQLSSLDQTELQFNLSLTAGYGTGVTFSCSGTCPDGMTVSAGGLVSWTPPPKYLGENKLTFLASTSSGAFPISVNVSVTSRFHTGMTPYRVIGQPDYVSCSGNLGAGPTNNSLLVPDGVSTYNGRIFVGDLLNHRVLFYNQEPTTNGAAADMVWGQVNFVSNPAGSGATGTSFPRMAVYNGQEFFVADANQHRILGFNSLPASATQTADFVLGQPDFVSYNANQGGSVAANTVKGNSAFSFFAIDSRLLLVDRGNNRVLIYNRPFHTNMNASLVLGQPDLVTSNIPASPPSATNFGYPGGIWTDGKRILLADGNPGNSRILVWSTFPTQNNQAPDLAIGQPDMVSGLVNQGGTPAANTISSAFGVASDGTRIFISDDNNHRVLIYNQFPTANNASADVVLGQPDFTTNPTNCTANGFARTSNLWWDGKDLLVADQGNNRILFFGK